MQENSEELEYFYIDEKTGEEVLIDIDEYEEIPQDEPSADDIKVEQNSSSYMLLFLMLQRWWVILLFGLFAGIFAAIYTFYFATPVYASTAHIIILKSKSDETVNTNDINASSVLAKDSITIAGSYSVLDKALENLDLKDRYTAAALKRNTFVRGTLDTRIISITVEDTSVEMSAKLTNAVSEAFVGMFDGFLAKTSDVDTSYSRIIEKAVVNENPVKPNLFLNIIFSIVFGTAFGFLLLFILELSDKRIKSPEKVIFASKLPVLGTIPIIELD